jgi:autotransporter-associated beta strand protein
MNNDDTFKNIPNNQTTGLTPELEVRVVAWVLGEATPAEAAELARLSAENPALADFKRRIETIHELAGAAARPAGGETLRLSDERRARVLAVIGEDAPEAGGSRTDDRAASMPRWVRAWNKWALPMAACLTLCLLLGAVIFPAIGAARKPKRPEPSSTVLGVATAPEVESDKIVPTEIPMVTFPTGSAAPVDNVVSSREAGEIAAAQVPVAVSAMPPPVSAPVTRGERTITLDAANTYTGRTVVTGGVLALDTLGKNKVAATGIGAFAADKKEPFVADNPKVPADGAATLGSGVSVAGLSSSLEANRGQLQVTAGAGSNWAANEGSYTVESKPQAPGAPVAQPPVVVFGQAGKDLLSSAIVNVSSGSTDSVAVRSQPLKEVRERAKVTNEDAKVAHQSALPAFDESLRTETATSQQAISTFSLHVSDASFRIAKAALSRGEAPDPASIRPEEFYNAFDYGDPSAVAGEPVACRIEQSAHPFRQQRNLLRIAMKVPATGRGAGQPLRLTVLLDTSGSMEREDRAAAVRAALTSLVSLLGADDRITLIGFARQPHLLADRVPGNQAAGLADLVAKTPFEGGTNLEEALKLAGNLARGQFTASAQNRIVLLTDGAANLGNDDPAQLAAMIAALRQQGIAFDACGVGADGLDDTILEALTRKGDGRYTVINSPEEADAGFARKLAGAFRPAAENVKLQVRFNPSRVARYRLIGFEQHRLKTEDFRNDRVDAAELAAEEAAVALYQVEVIPDGEGELGEVFVRFRETATGNMVERSWTLAYAPQPPAFSRATPSMKLAGTAAFLAEKLRGGDLAAQIRLDELAPAVNALRSDYAQDARVQDLVTMFAQARRLAGE